MVNRDKHNDEMVELRLTGLNSEDEQWFDLYHGTKLGNMEYNNFSEPFTLHVEANGYGAILVTLDDVPGNYYENANIEYMLTSILVSTYKINKHKAS